MHTAPLPAAEQKRFGQYVLISEVARGTFGRLWTACRRLDSGEAEAVLIRRLQKKAPLDDAALDGVRRAVELRTPVEGGHLVRMRGIEETDDELGIVFDYSDGKDLKSLLGIAPLKHLRAPAPVAIHVIASALESLAHLRRELPEEFATAAVWPDSIFVGADGDAHMLDPSISAALGRVPGPRKFPQLVGYSSPEEFGDDDDLGQADVFRAGILLWEMLCAKRLFTGGTTNTTIEQVQHAPIAVIEDLPLQHAPLADVVKQALAQERGVRYGAPDELLDALLTCGVPRATNAEVAAFMTELVGTGLAAQQRAVAIALERVAAEEPEEKPTDDSPKLALATATPAPVAKTVMSQAVPALGPPKRSETLLGVPAPAILGAKPMPMPPPPPPPPPQRNRPAPIGGVPLDLTPIDDLESPLPSSPKQVRTEHSAIALLDSLGAPDTEPLSGPTEALNDDDLVEQSADDDLLEPVAAVAATQPLGVFPSAPPPALGAELDSIAPGPQPRFKRTHVMAVAAGLAVLLLVVGVLAVVGRGSPKEEETLASATASAAAAASVAPVETAPEPEKTAEKPAPSASAPPATSAEVAKDETDAGVAVAALVPKKAVTTKKLAVGSTKPKAKTTAKSKTTKTTAKSKTTKSTKKPTKKTTTKTTKKPVKPKKKTK